MQTWASYTLAYVASPLISGLYNANQANTKHDDSLKYNGPTTRARTKKFKDALQVFMKSIWCETNETKIQYEKKLHFVHLIQVQDELTVFPGLKQLWVNFWLFVPW